MEAKYKKRRKAYNARALEKKRRTGRCYVCPRLAAAGRRRCWYHLEQNWRPIYCTRCYNEVSHALRRKRHLRMHPHCAKEQLRERKRWDWPRASRQPAYRKAHLRAVLAYQERHRRNGLCKSCPSKRVRRSRYCRRHIGDGHPGALAKKRIQR